MEEFGCNAVHFKCIIFQKHQIIHTIVDQKINKPKIDIFLGLANTNIFLTYTYLFNDNLTGAN